MNRKLVVGVIGTQNTGKSTFIGDVIGQCSTTGFEFKTVGCDYRKKIAEAGLSINRNGDLRSQKIICDTLIEQLDIIDTLPNGCYFTDRTPLDAYVYTAYLFRHRPELGITQQDMDEMFKKVKSAMARYDKVVYINLDECDNVQVVDDKFRDTNLEYRKEIDMLFKETLPLLCGDVLKGKVVRGICGGRQERVNRFLEAIGNELSDYEVVG